MPVLVTTTSISKSRPLWCLCKWTHSLLTRLAQEALKRKTEMQLPIVTEKPTHSSTKQLSTNLTQRAMRWTLFSNSIGIPRIWMFFREAHSITILFQTEAKHLSQNWHFWGAIKANTSNPPVSERKIEKKSVCRPRLQYAKKRCIRNKARATSS